MAIAATWVVQNSSLGTAATQLYTVPSTGYNRDLVVSNSGASTIFVGLSGSGTVATSLASFQVPTGGTIILTQCQVPAGAVLSALAPSAAGGVAIGYGSNVSYI